MNDLILGGEGLIGSTLAEALRAKGRSARSLHLGGKVARLWNTYGWEEPDVKSHVITDLVLSGLTEARVVCRTSGVERRRFIYRTDCVAALIQLFDGPQQTAEIAGTEWLTI